MHLKFNTFRKLANLNAHPKRKVESRLDIDLIKLTFAFHVNEKLDLERTFVSFIVLNDISIL